MVIVQDGEAEASVEVRATDPPTKISTDPLLKLVDR